MSYPYLVRSAAVLLLGIIGPSCGPGAPEQVLTVEEVVPRIDELNGRTVSVFGYLPECRGYTCILYRNKDDADEWDRMMTAIIANRPFSRRDVPILGIGAGGTRLEFDDKAAPFTKRYVVITGTITNECRFEGKPACTDRGPDLKPTAIRAGAPPAP